MKSIAFGGKEHERLEINVFGYGCAASGNYHDVNWLSVETFICCGGFHGKFPATFFTGDLQSFHSQLASLYQILTGTAKFETLEGQLKLEATGDGLGHIKISGEALDQAGIGNKLIFEIGIDQTQLQTSVQSLAAATSAFPVRT
ncbi:WapI family immunity protein [Rhodanobacter hydrolyticus]|uniref:Uncharacterized protein n=1 Tax=Rhodanobacter hydrolyticus TaxID=2250595 RepID=A0ABW8J4K7_9GAMM